GNDRFVALDLLKNANISAGGVLPMCQDTGTAIGMGKKSEGVLTGADDGEAISRGVHDAYTRLNLRYSQLAPLTTYEESNTGTAIVMGTQSEAVLAGARDGGAVSRVVPDAYPRRTLRYAQPAPRTTYEERHPGTRLPAQIETYSTPHTRSASGEGRPEYKFLF